MFCFYAKRTSRNFYCASRITQLAAIIFSPVVRLGQRTFHDWSAFIVQQQFAQLVCAPPLSWRYFLELQALLNACLFCFSSAVNKGKRYLL